MTFFTTSYGSDLSASTVISRDASAASAGCGIDDEHRPLEHRAQRLDHVRTRVAQLSAMSATNSPCTKSWSLRDHHDDGLVRLHLRRRLRNLDTLRVLHDFDVVGIHEQERHHHRKDVDQRNQVELGILALMQMMFRLLRIVSSRLMVRLPRRCW